MAERFANSLAEFLERQYGVRTNYAINPISAVVNIAVTQLLNTNPKRLGWFIINLSANTVYLAPDQQVAAARGILLVPTGGSFGMQWNEDFQLVTLPVFGTATANNSAVMTVEIYISG